MLKKIIFFITIVWIGVIWVHSMMPAPISRGESGAIAQWLQAIGIVSDGKAVEHIIRKIAHFTEFGLLGVLIFLDMAFSFKINRQCVPLALFIGLVIPMIDETIQLFSMGRSCAVVDVWLDFGGYVTGWLFTLLISRKLLNKTVD